jgi:D-sedoheptulose 7-phosphate isomerase
MKDLEELIKQRGRESAKAQEEFCASSAGMILNVVNSLVKVIRSGGKILVLGNGGSAADAQHFAAELVSRFLMERHPLPCVALTTDTSVITSISNDYSFDQIFSKQVEALGKEGDAVIAISTSGASPNVLKALERANVLSLLTIGLTGGESEQMASLCDFCLNVDSSFTPRVQEVHHLILHIISELLEIRLFTGRDD